MDQQTQELVAAITRACDGHPHPVLLRQALTFGFALVEEVNGKKEETFYGPAESAADVVKLLPKAQASLDEMERSFLAEAAGARLAEFEDLPDGMTAAEMREIQYLAGRQQLGALRPDFDEETEGLTEEKSLDMAELQRLAAG